ncbi:MAG: hypothetical protein J1E00_06320 [Oscillospiraceae bacterium]|nr:hypothetical protein [Oscillospiraceae bacterium]
MEPKEKKNPAEKRNLTEKEKLKRVVLIVAGVFLALLLLTGILWILNSLVSNMEPDTEGTFSFYEADYDRDIFEYAPYQRLNRSITYLEYGSGVTLTEDNYLTEGVASAFFYKYFDAVIRGDCDAYRAYLTPHYIETYRPPERFTMQMLYNIEVNREQKVSTAEFEGKTAIVHYFSVKYSIFENNGTFRRDVGSNTSTTQYYEIYVVGGRFYLNAISNKKMVING